MKERKAAWLLLHKLRRAMVNPERKLLRGVVEIGETNVPYRKKTDPVSGGQGRSPIGKMVLVGAVEIVDKFYAGRSFVLKWVHRIFSNFKRWAMGTYHGLREKHIDIYCNEFVFRWNRRRSFQTSIDTMLGLLVRKSAAPPGAASSETHGSGRTTTATRCWRWSIPSG